MITSSTALAEIASNHPALTRELERLGLDYCCGGKRSLAEACREQNLDPDVVVAELTSSSSSSEAAADWIGMSPAELVDHLEGTHHQYLKQELPRLSELIRLAEIYAKIRAELEPHLRKEEEVLFPMVRTLASAAGGSSRHGGSIAVPIAVMEQEHIMVGGLLEQLRGLTQGYQAPEGTCDATRALMAGLAELEADTHLHVHKENNHLFPAVMTLEDRLSTSSSLHF